MNKKFVKMNIKKLWIMKKREAERELYSKQKLFCKQNNTAWHHGDNDKLQNQ